MKRRDRGLRPNKQKRKTEKKKFSSHQESRFTPVREQTDAETDLASSPMLPCLMVP